MNIFTRYQYYSDLTIHFDLPLPKETRVRLFLLVVMMVSGGAVVMMVPGGQVEALVAA